MDAGLVILNINPVILNEVKNLFCPCRYRD